ncbi:MAG TPA: potassium transporter TrkG [Mycobacteriales bacterium]|jgi:potassium uptake TrkH family protein|nr:potassium transporter TrkG [Mycobacteriales bacterium]
MGEASTGRPRLLAVLLGRAVPRLRHPAQVVVAGFAAAATVGALLLLLPVSRRETAGASVVDALFTATSAVCVTGLITVDTPTYWSGFGQAVIVALIQVGGFGIMALATLLSLLVSHKVGIRNRLNAAAEVKSLGLSDVRRVLVGVTRTSLLFEAAGAGVLALRFATSYDEPVGRALWLGVFHAVSAFNNAGFALYSDNMIGFATDPVVSLTLCVLVIAGGLGFPVLFELRRAWRTPRRWTVHSKIVLSMTGVLLFLGTAVFLLLEWSNPRTLGPMSAAGKAVAGFFQGVQPRTAGFNSISTGDLNPETLLATDVLMFIGGGSAGTAGGIKVTTFAVLLAVIVTEVRGDESVTAFSRRIPREVQRQALSVALLAVAVVVSGTGLLLQLTAFSLDQVLFEVVSAFSTVGLSTGITAQVGTAGQLLLTALMFLGRLGPITLAAALALRTKPRLYDLPYDRPIIG